ncbi:MAG: hypothetical protein U0166_15895 [Acidobacteriota bacterium]
MTSTDDRNPGASGRANLGLGLAIGGLVASVVPCCCMTYWLGLPLNVVSLVINTMERNAIETGQSSPGGQSQVKTARLLSFVGFGFNALYAVFVVLYLMGVVGLGILGGLSNLK